MSGSFNMQDNLYIGSVCSLNLKLVIVRIALFCTRCDVSRVQAVV